MRRTRNEHDRLAVVGLGKLGLPWACVLASAEYKVVGIDADRQHVERLLRGEYEGTEPQVARILACAGDRIDFTADFSEIARTNMAFVIVPTPSDDNDRFSLEYVLPAVAQIASQAGRHAERYTLVIVSTVMPGDCRGAISRAIVEAAGSNADHIQLVYSPEFVALGDVVEGMRSPDLILIGADHRSAAKDVREVYESVVSSNPKRVVTSWESAEIAKLAINSCVATKIACSNLVGQICQETPHAHVNDVTLALGADHRIGRRCTSAGLGFGGPCLPRDVRALASVCEDLGVDRRLPDALSAFNLATPQRLSDIVRRLEPVDTVVGFLGLSYRVGSPLLEQSQALEMARLLVDAGIGVTAYDPLVDADESQVRDLGISLRETPRDVLREAPRIVVATPDPAFRWLSPQLLCGKTVFDIWRVVSRDLVQLMHLRSVKENFDFTYVPFGSKSSHGVADSSFAPTSLV